MTLRLHSKHDVMDGEPCFAGTRIPITSVWEFGAAGYSVEAIQKQYPSLSVAQIGDALALVDWYYADDTKEADRG